LTAEAGDAPPNRIFSMRARDSCDSFSLSRTDSPAVGIGGVRDRFTLEVRTLLPDDVRLVTASLRDA
jgi:hypothetical protein